MSAASELVFFLGGQDLEMVTLRALLEESAPGRFYDAGLGWSEAKASRYRETIEAVAKRGQVPVLVELENDLGLDEVDCVVVDHHGSRAGRGRATALEQVFDLLELPRERWDRWLELVAANDRAYIAGLAEAGASREEMVRVRAADRRAQGIGEAEEQAAERAVEGVESRLGGRLLVAHLPHARTAALTDRLAPELGGPGFDNLLIRSPGEVNVFAAGPVIEHLAAAFPDGWYGGNLPQHGYFGRSADDDAVLRALETWLA